MRVRELIKHLECFDVNLSVVVLLGNEEKQNVIERIVFEDYKCIIECED